jgi:hypothetical protein
MPKAIRFVLDMDLGVINGIEAAFRRFSSSIWIQVRGTVR